MKYAKTFQTERTAARLLTPATAEISGQEYNLATGDEISVTFTIEVELALWPLVRLRSLEIFGVTEVEKAGRPVPTRI